MDILAMLLTTTAPLIPAIVVVLTALIAGGITGIRLAIASAKIAAIYVEKTYDNADKRELVVNQLYDRFPVVGKFIPRKAMRDIVEAVYQNVVKPLVVMPLPPAPPKVEEPKVEEPKVEEIPVKAPKKKNTDQ